MISFIKRMWAAAPIATVILALALTASVAFGVRSVASWVYWNDPAHIDQPVAGWMTPRYVAHSWDVPREVMIGILDSQRPGDGMRNLQHIAEDRGLALDDLISLVNTAITEFRASQRQDTEGKP